MIYIELQTHKISVGTLVNKTYSIAEALVCTAYSLVLFSKSTILQRIFLVARNVCLCMYHSTMTSCNSTICWQLYVVNQTFQCPIVCYIKHNYTFCCTNVSSLIIIRAVHSITLMATSDVNRSLGICGNGSRSG